MGRVVQNSRPFRCLILYPPTPLSMGRTAGGWIWRGRVVGGYRIRIHFGTWLYTPLPRPTTSGYLCSQRTPPIAAGRDTFSVPPYPPKIYPPSGGGTYSVAMLDRQ